MPFKAQTPSTLLLVFDSAEDKEREHSMVYGSVAVVSESFTYYFSLHVSTEYLNMLPEIHSVPCMEYDYTWGLDW
jgi:hypothetical protein